MKVINSNQAPAPIGPYNQAIEYNGLVYCSGQIALDPEHGHLVLDSIEAETHQVMKNIQAILTEAGLTFNHLIKTTIFLSDMNLFATVNEIYASYFDGHFPARETVAVLGLPKGVHVEISVIAGR